MDLNVELHFLPVEPLPPPTGKPFFSLLDHTLSRELSRRLTRPFWIDTVGRSQYRRNPRRARRTRNLRILASRTYAYASNSEIFFIWTVIASLVIIAIATSFLRNQIRPILRLARAAEEFGKGREVAFSPRGAREVRQAGAAFLEMKRRVERAMEQRTTMLNGVSHDLRTIITRFKLSLALIGERPRSDGVEEGRRRDGAHGRRPISPSRAATAARRRSTTDVCRPARGARAESERHGLQAQTRYSATPADGGAARRRSVAASPISSATPSATPSA